PQSGDRDGGDDQIASPERLCGIGSEVDVLRNGDVGQVAQIAACFPQALAMRRIARPQCRRMARSERYGQRRPPRSGPEDGNPHSPQIWLILMKPVTPSSWRTFAHPAATSSSSRKTLFSAVNTTAAFSAGDWRTSAPAVFTMTVWRSE